MTDKALSEVPFYKRVYSPRFKVGDAEWRAVRISSIGFVYEYFPYGYYDKHCFRDRMTKKKAIAHGVPAELFEWMKELKVRLRKAGQL